MGSTGSLVSDFKPRSYSMTMYPRYCTLYTYQQYRIEVIHLVFKYIYRKTEFWVVVCVTCRQACMLCKQYSYHGSGNTMVQYHNSRQ
jgi:hypothetical protein